MGANHFPHLPPHRFNPVQRARHDNHFTGNVVDIEFSDSTVTATVNHPFWVMSGGSLNERPAPDQLEEHESEGLSLDGRWLQSQDLRVGDVVFCRDGETREVMSMAIREADSLPISNLSIREWPNYAVGVGGVLVHNRGLCETDIDELAQVIAAHAPDERPVLIKELADDNVASADLDQIRSKIRTEDTQTVICGAARFLNTRGRVCAIWRVGRGFS